MEDVKYAHIDDAEVINEGVNTEATVADVNDNEARFQRAMQDWAEMYQKMHTPFKRVYPKARRNEICPFCDSGLKFKHCECFQKYGEQLSY